MALMAVLRASSRSMASRLDFCKKKKIRRRLAKMPTMMISRIVKPFLVFML